MCCWQLSVTGDVWSLIRGDMPSSSQTRCEFCDVATPAVVECCGASKLCLVHFMLHGHAAHKAYKVISDEAFKLSFKKFRKLVSQTNASVKKVVAKHAATATSPKNSAAKPSVTSTRQKRATPDTRVPGPMAAGKKSSATWQPSVKSAGSSGQDAPAKTPQARGSASAESPGQPVVAGDPIDTKTAAERSRSRVRQRVFEGIRDALLTRAASNDDSNVVTKIASDIEQSLFGCHSEPSSDESGGLVPSAKYQFQSSEILFCINDVKNSTFARSLLDKTISAQVEFLRRCGCDPVTRTSFMNADICFSGVLVRECMCS